MVSNMENLSKTTFEKKMAFFRNKFVISFFLFFIILTGLALHYVKANSAMYITAKFSESGPLRKNMPVYYKGYKIGITKVIWLAEDYKHSFAKISFYPKNPKISEDATAKVKRHDLLKMDYIEIIVPEDSSETILKKGDTIEGEGAFDLDAFLSEIADANLIVPLLQSFTDTSESINKTSSEAGNSFSELRSILKENRNNIKRTTKELASTTKSLNQISSNLNISLTKTTLNNSTKNIDKSTSNILETTESIKNITANIDKATKNIDKTVEKIDCTISETNSTIGNLKAITCGFRKTLAKNFGGFRVIFGKSIKCDRCPNNCCR